MPSQTPCAQVTRPQRSGARSLAQAGQSLACTAKGTMLSGCLQGESGGSEGDPEGLGRRLRVRGLSHCPICCISTDKPWVSFFLICKIPEVAIRSLPSEISRCPLIQRLLTPAFSPTSRSLPGPGVGSAPATPSLPATLPHTNTHPEGRAAWVLTQGRAGWWPRSGGTAKAKHVLIPSSVLVCEVQTVLELWRSMWDHLEGVHRLPTFGS